jgi:hypothetical protein
VAEDTGRRRAVARKSRPLFNWLKWFDGEVQAFREPDQRKHRGFAFGRCRLFIMARFPRIERPFPDEVLNREFLRGQEQISGHQDASRILEGLNDKKKIQLAALHLDVVESLEAYRAHNRNRGAVLRAAREAPRRLRTLASKLAKARSALQGLRRYAERLDELLFAHDYVCAAKACMGRLDRLHKNTDSEFYRSEKAEYRAVEDPVTLAMVQLYWFFRYGCRLSGDEAEVRVALLRNAFWKKSGKYGVVPVLYRATYTAEESMGCAAVHVAVNRFRLS